MVIKAATHKGYPYRSQTKDSNKLKYVIILHNSWVGCILCTVFKLVDKRKWVIMSLKGRAELFNGA